MFITPILGLELSSDIGNEIKIENVIFVNKDRLPRIQIKCAVENRSSSNIPKRLGFKFEGIERDGEPLIGNVFTDLEVYS